jgi:hypothetical protein
MFYRLEIEGVFIEEEEIDKINSIIRSCCVSGINFCLCTTTSKIVIYFEGEDISNKYFLTNIIYCIDALRNSGILE